MRSIILVQHLFRKASQPNQLPLQVVLKNLADSVAIQFHELSKKCINVMKKRMEQQQKRRELQRAKIIQRYRNNTRKPQFVNYKPVPVQSQVVRPNTMYAKATQQQPQPEQSRLARINRIKEAMYNKRAEQQQQNQEPPANASAPDDQIFQHFAKEFGPQILAKYPTASLEKVNKVILQKWNTIDPVKKESYIKKTRKRLQQNKKMQENIEKKIESQTNEKGQNEVKREEEDTEFEAKEQRQAQSNPFGQYLDKIKIRDNNQNNQTSEDIRIEAIEQSVNEPSKREHVEKSRNEEIQMLHQEEMQEETGQNEVIGENDKNQKMEQINDQLPQ